ncbi:MAG: peptidylprolyl isomerase [Bacteroidota bacterium]
MDRTSNSDSWLLALLLLTASPVNEAVHAQTVIDRIVAVVGNEIILESELNASVQFYVFNNRIDPNTPRLKEQVLEAMVNEKLMLAKAIEDSVVVSEEEVTQELDRLIQEGIQRFGSEQRLVETYGMPVSRIKLEFRSQTENQLMISRLQQMKFGSITVTRREVEKFFSTYQDSLPRVPEQVELRHIFIVPKVDEKTKARTYAKAQAILDSIRAGGDFADFARRYSQDPGSAAKGGDLGFVRRGLFVKEFEEAVFALQQGELSNVVETDRGLHIIQLLERRGESVRPRHILIKVERDETSDQEAIALLKSLKDTVLNQQETFAEMAKRHSEDEETSNIGGSLGLVPLEQLDPNIVTPVRELREKEISDPVRVRYGDAYGYHIFLLEKRLPEHAMNLKDDWKTVEQFTTTHKRNAEYSRWLEELHQSIYWEVRL